MGTRSRCLGSVTQDVTGPAVGVAGCRGMAEPLDGVARPRRRSGRRVRSQVALQQCAVREDLAAGGAGRALRPVCAHVHVERALLREALGADGALEGAHARVRDHMLEQVVAQRERSPAHGALVGLLACGRQGRPRTHGQPGRDPPPSLDQLSIQNPLRERALPPLPDLAAQQRSPGMGRYVLSPPPSWDIPLPDPYLTSYHNTTDCRGPATVTGTLLPWSPASVGCCCLLRLTTQVTPVIQGPPCPDLCRAERASGTLVTGRCARDSLARPSTCTMGDPVYLPRSAKVRTPACWPLQWHQGNRAGCFSLWIPEGGRGLC